MFCAFPVSNHDNKVKLTPLENIFHSAKNELAIKSRGAVRASVMRSGEEFLRQAHPIGRADRNVVIVEIVAGVVYHARSFTRAVADE